MINTIGKHRKACSIFFFYILVGSEFASFSYGMQSLEKGKLYYSNLPQMLDFSSNLDQFESHTGGIDQRNQTLDFVHKNAEIVSVQTAASGPGQAENTGFSVSSTDGSVDKFTGDFSHNIPLMDVEGYPISISYSSNVNMHSEASWVGLGWDLSIGGITREMRGVPDEANGNDEIVKTFKERQDVVEGRKFGAYVAASFANDFSPSVQLTLLRGKYDDNYLGIGKTLDFNVQGQFTLPIPLGESMRLPLNLGGSFGYSKDTKHGIGINKGFNVGVFYLPIKPTFGSSYHSRAGTYEKTRGIAFPMIDVMKTVPYGTTTMIPKVEASSITNTFQFGLELFAGIAEPTGSAVGRVGLLYKNYNNNTTLVTDNHKIVQPVLGYLHSGKREDLKAQGKLVVMDFERSSDFQYSTEMKHLPFSMQTYDLFHVGAMGIGGTFRAGRTDFGTYVDPTTTNQVNQKDIETELPESMDNWPQVLKDAFAEIFDGPEEIDIALGVDVKGPTLDFSITGEVGGQWGGTISNDWTKPIDFTQVAATNNFDNTTYFKAVGELTPNSKTAWDGFQGNSPIAMKVVPMAGATSGSINLLSGIHNSPANLVPSTVNSWNAGKKPITADVFIPKTVADFPSNATFKIYEPNGSLNFTPISRLGVIRKANHISAIDVINTDGTKYVFGIPVYNIEHQEIIFSSGRKDDGTAALSTINSEGFLVHEPTDASPSNDRGRSQMFDKTSMPAYPHTFLLTEVLSSDYIDRSANGPSIDDIGNYYKFNYTKGGVTDYKWRFPVSGGSNAASYPCAVPNEGFLGTTLDDVASYSYGIKEVYYTHSVESKNLIAVFHLLDRKDGHAVMSENGVLDPNNSLQKLDKIVLYNLNDYKLNMGNAIPLQTVYFDYSYELCELYPSNINNFGGTGQTGKLTLKGIRIQSGNSKELTTYNYEFGYSTVNPTYNYFMADAWGTYDVDNDANKPNELFPYADQNKITADINSSAWKMIHIKNPSGGIMEIEYEADCYGFVQNRRASRHFDVVGMMDLFHLLGEYASPTFNLNYLSNTFVSSTTESTLASYQITKGQSQVSGEDFARRAFNNSLPFSTYGKIKEGFLPNNVLVFKLDESIPSSYTLDNATQKVQADYFTDNDASPNGRMSELFLKLKVRVKPSTGDPIEELIPAVLKISSNWEKVFLNECLYSDNFDAIGVLPPTQTNGDYTYGYVVLEPHNNGEYKSKLGEDTEGVMLHPFQQFALGYVRQNLPDVVYGACVSCEAELSVDRKVAFGAEMNKALIKAKYVETFDPNASTIRLYEPDRIKYGGNGRVKSITYKDNWQASSGEYEGVYYWLYEYGEDVGRQKESGVAAFEPNQIMDENTHYSWDSYYNIRKKFPDERMFHPTPIARALYPSAQVGYEHVLITFTNSFENGHSLTTFHTYKNKDYKTNFSSTGIKKLADILSPETGWGRAYYSDAYEKHGYSEGYLVETNDFHGKISSQTIYKKVIGVSAPVIISKTTYHYKSLKSLTPMMDRDNNVKDEFAGVEYDVHSDSRFVLDQSFFALTGLRFSLQFTPPTVVKAKIRPTTPKFQHYEKAFYSNCIIKHINYSALIDRIETEYLGSINIAKNEVYDQYTGNPIISSLTDEYGDNLYDYSFPSHWYENSLREYPLHSASNVSGTTQNGSFTIASGGDLTNYFSVGDLVLIGGSTQCYIYDLNTTTATLMKPDGTMASGLSGTAMKRLSSNRKNRLDETMQNMVTKKKYTIDPSTGKVVFPNVEIISCSAINYKYKDGMRCGGENTSGTGDGLWPDNQVQIGQVINPFEYGLRSDLVMDGQFAWQSERQDYHNHGIRFDGVYNTFEPFYRYDNATEKWMDVEQVFGNFQKWRKMGEAIRYDEYGQVVEVSDQINVRSSILYGHSPGTSILPIAQAINGLQKEIAFDGFEDYAYMATNVFVTETHFDFRQIALVTPWIAAPVKTERHSGNYSLRVGANQTAIVQKSVAAECLRVITEPLPNEINEVSECSCTPPFEPIPGKEYLISLWVKDNGLGASVLIEFVGSSGPLLLNNVSISPSGAIIDGWQKIEGSFMVPVNAESISVSLINPSTVPVYFDDLRIHPYLAGMTTVVYDDKTNLPMATHDGYNYTTFYNYDENLNLVRVRVETIEGIKTISESEFGMKKY
jgi:hypothetical protein